MIESESLPEPDIKNLGINHKTEKIFPELEEKESIRCDCCYDPATTQYYDSSLRQWFDVCESCKRFLVIQEQLEKVIECLPDDVKNKIEGKIHQ